MMVTKKRRLSRYQQAALLELLEKGLKHDANQSLLSFTTYTKPEYEINWHHKALCEHLDKFAKGEIKRLMVFMPPRHGKSELVSRRLPPYMLGKNPDIQIIAASYSDSLASTMSRDVQRIIESSEYRFLFPDIKIGQISPDGSKWIKNSAMFEIMGRRGIYKSAGIGTGITGLGANVIIIDDPVKDQTEVHYKSQRDRVWDWYTSVISTRLEKDAQILLTMTRWHEDDLAGRLLDVMKSDPKADQWTILNLPAIREDEIHICDVREKGEALWPSKYSVDDLERIKMSLGSKVWNALYQQSPRAEGGNIVRRDWWQFYSSPPEKFDSIIQSWDLTFKEVGTSYVVGQVWGMVGTKKYLLDQLRSRMGFVETISAIKTMCAKWPKYSRLLIEDKANGPAVMDAIKKEVSGVISVQPNGSKESRVNAVSAQIEAGEVFLPERAEWLHDYIEEFTMFPNGAADDQVDATSQALLDVKNSGAGKLSNKYLPESTTSNKLDW